MAIHIHSNPATSVCVLFGGTIVDRHHRKPLIIGNAVLQLLIWFAISVLIINGKLTLTSLAVGVCISACANGFLGEATNAALRSIISMQDYPKARSINEGRDATINMTGSPIGGILYSIQPWLPFVCSTLVYTIAGGSATQLRLNEHEEQAGATGNVHTREHAIQGSSFLDDFKEGWGWVFHRQRLPTIIVAASLINFGVAGIQYTIQLHLISIGTLPFRIGLMDTGVCAGMLIGSILANRLSDKIHVGKAACIAFAMILLFVTPMAVNNTYWVLLICYTFMGLPVPLVNSSLLGFVFSKTEQNMQGRVSTAVSVPAQVLSMFCSGIAGTLLPKAGFTATMVSFLAAIALSVLVAVSTRAIRTIPPIKPVAQHATLARPPPQRSRPHAPLHKTTSHATGSQQPAPP